MGVFWRFNGEGCESCGARAGDYPHPVGGPHENCQCSTAKIVIDEICVVVGEEELSRENIGEVQIDLGPGSALNSRRQQLSILWLMNLLQERECCKVENGEVTNDCETHFEGVEREEWTDLGEVEVVEV